MRFVFIVGHPAHVHFFRNAIQVLRLRGDEVHIGAIAKETTFRLLDAYGLDFEPLGRNVPNVAGKLADLPRKDIHFMRFLRRLRPDVVISVSSPYAAHACSILGIPHIAFGDTEVARGILRLTYPFTDAFVTPASFTTRLGKRQFVYEGYKELAYLHPNWFHPDPRILELIPAKPSDRLILVRFSSWDSSHDLREQKMRATPTSRIVGIVRTLEKFGKPLITSERRLPDELEPYALKIPLTEIHNVIFYSTLYIGEGATMASEAGILGTPWIFVSQEPRGWLTEQQEHYNLGFWEQSWDSGIARAMELLSDSETKHKWQTRKDRLIEDKIDVTDYIVRFVGGWPDHDGPVRIPGAETDSPDGRGGIR